MDPSPCTSASYDCGLSFLQRCVLLRAMSAHPPPESRRCAKPDRSLPRIPRRSSHVYHMHRTVIRNHVSRGASGEPVGKPTPARRWRTCGASTARPSATGSRATTPEACRPCWRGTCRRANPRHCLQRCWPPWSRGSGTPPASPPLSHGARGATRPRSGRSTIIPATASSVPAFRPRSRCHGPVTPTTR